MDIFIVEDNRVTAHPQALLIRPFSEIWQQHEPAEALLRFSYIEFMCSYSSTNPFIGYEDHERGGKILDAILPSNAEDTRRDEIRLDPLVIKGMSVYKKSQTEASPSIRFYEASLEAAHKMVDFFNNFDLAEVNTKTGNPLYRPADITRALKDVNDILKTLANIRDNVHRELAEAATGKGDRKINYFETVESAKK